MRSHTKTKHRALAAIAFPVLMVGVLACGPVARVLNPVKTATPTAMMSADTPTLTPDYRPTSTVTPTPTEVPQAPSPLAAACPLPSSLELNRPTGFAEYPDAIREYLSAGGDLEALRSKLRLWNALPTDGNQVISSDLTGDGADEVILALADPAGRMITRPGVLLIFGCSEGSYQSVFRAGDGQDDMFSPEIRLTQVADVNHDNLPDVVYVLRTCGAHTCYESLKIVAWNGSEVASLMGGALELPYPSYTIGPGRIRAVSGGIGSVGAEPQRTHTEIWTWNGSIFTITRKVYEPVVYRYHALLDGDRALQAGDYVTATQMYERVINDQRLEQWGAVSGMVPPGEERARLSAFARWRLVLTYVLMGKTGEAQAAHHGLLENHPSGEVGHDTAVMAQTFWEAYEQSKGISEGCSAILAAPVTYTSVLDFFNNSYGYANPWWEPADLCPLTELR